MSLITLALGVAAHYVPDLVGKLTGDKDKERVAKSIIRTAKAVTGIEEPESALAAFNPNKEQQAALRADIIRVIALETGDIQDARKHDDEVSDHLSYQVMYMNPLFICIGIGALIWLSTQELAAGILSTASALIGAALNQFYQERQQVMNYRFGSSLGSKLKSMVQK